MFDKIKNLPKHPFIQQLRDVRSVGLMVFGVIVLLISWSGVKAIQTNYDLQKQISELQQQNQVGQLQNNNDKLRNQYLQTDQYLELAARRDFGKAAPGETVLIVPKNVALAHTIAIPKPATLNQADTQIHQPTYQKNFQAWIDFFLHRQNTGS